MRPRRVTRALLSTSSSIVERLLSGKEYDLSRIDDEVDAWHEADTTVPLHEWLGLTTDEYEVYVEQPASIRIILAARRQNRSLKELLAAKDAISLAAARGVSAAEVTELGKWLKATGRLSRPGTPRRMGRTGKVESEVRGTRGRETG